MKRKLTLKIGRHKIGEGQPTFVIAEIGSNHNRDLRLAKKIIKKVSKTGADAVKFQTFRADQLVNRKQRLGAYKLLKANELPFEWHSILKKYAEKHGLIFLSSPFDFEAVALLRKLNVFAYKIASGDLTNLPLINEIAQVGKPLMISVGAADNSIIRAAVEAIRQAGNEKIVLCQCVVNYPTEYSDANVAVLDHLKKEFKTLVGYSDHSREKLVPILAVAKGAAVIERHVTLSRSLKGPDHSFALEIEELKAMVNDIRKTEKILGNGEKNILPCEEQACFRARRSICAKNKLRRGEEIGKENLLILRPKVGLDPSCLDSIIGKKISKDVESLEPISLENIL